MSGDLVTKLASIVIDGRRTMEEVALSVASAMDGSGDLSELRGLLSEEELGQLQGGPTGFRIRTNFHMIAFPGQIQGVKSYRVTPKLHIFL